jgi:uncharacterized DUF497 family protein
MDLSEREFEWDRAKEAANVIKHGVDFSTAQLAFADPRRVIAEDLTHRQGEDRFYCISSSRLTVASVCAVGSLARRAASRHSARRAGLPAARGATSKRELL